METFSFKETWTSVLMKYMSKYIEFAIGSYTSPPQHHNRTSQTQQLHMYYKKVINRYSPLASTIGLKNYGSPDCIYKDIEGCLFI